jgi:hypothetical protein
MANSYAVDYTKRHVTTPAKLTDVSTNGGRMRVLYDTYTVVAADVDGQVVYFGRLPGGAKVWDASIYNSATLGTSTTIDLGWSAVISTGSTDTDGFLDGVAGTGTTTTAFMRGGADTTSGNLNTISNAPVAIANEASVVATLIGADPNAGVILQVMITYSID